MLTLILPVRSRVWYRDIEDSGVSGRVSKSEGMAGDIWLNLYAQESCGVGVGATRLGSVDQIHIDSAKGC